MPVPNVTALERAFELARSGQCRSTDEITQALKQEGYDAKRVVGPFLIRQLRAVMHEAARLKGR
jgi:hypothetical protein